MKKLRKYGNALVGLFLVASISLNAYLIIKRNTNAYSSAPEISVATEPLTAEVSHASSPELSHPPEAETYPEPEPPAKPATKIYGIELAPWVDTIRNSMPIPSGLDRDIEMAMGDSTREVFKNAPERLLEYDRYFYMVPYISDKIFSTFHNFTLKGEDPYHGVYYASTEVCLTYDLTTGKILGLDDILDVEAFKELIHIEGYLKFPEGSGSLEGPQQERLDFYKEHGFFAEEIDKLCDPGVTELHIPSYSLDKDRIWLYDIGDNFLSYLYVEYEDIRDILKIELGDTTGLPSVAIRAELRPIIRRMRESWLFSYYMNSEQQTAWWNSIHEAFKDAPDEIFEYDQLGYNCPYISDTLFCTTIYLTYTGEDEEHGIDEYATEIFLTFDLQQSKLLSLDEVVDIEKFKEIIHIEGYLKFPEGLSNLEGPQQDTLDFYNEQGFFTEEIDKLCDVSITEFHRPSFFLDEDRIWLYDLGRYEFTYLFVEYEDIRDILKIELGEILV